MSDTTQNNEICRMDALGLAELIQKKQLSPVEVIDAVLERMTTLEPALHAFCTPTPDNARADARRIEAELVAGNTVGPWPVFRLGSRIWYSPKGFVRYRAPGPMPTIFRTRTTSSLSA